MSALQTSKGFKVFPTATPVKESAPAQPSTEIEVAATPTDMPRWKPRPPADAPVGKNRKARAVAARMVKLWLDFHADISALQSEYGDFDDADDQRDILDSAIGFAYATSMDQAVASALTALGQNTHPDDAETAFETCLGQRPGALFEALGQRFVVSTGGTAGDLMSDAWGWREDWKLIPVDPEEAAAYQYFGPKRR